MIQSEMTEGVVLVFPQRLLERFLRLVDLAMGKKRRDFRLEGSRRCGMSSSR
jgi:hypothetical protein